MAPETQLEIRIMPMTAADWAAVRAIYQEGIATGNSTFETATPDWEKWDRDRLPGCRLIACAGGEVLGWAASSPVSSRSVYRGVTKSASMWRLGRAVKALDPL